MRTYYMIPRHNTAHSALRLYVRCYKNIVFQTINSRLEDGISVTAYIVQLCCNNVHG